MKHIELSTMKLDQMLNAYSVASVQVHGRLKVNPACASLWECLFGQAFKKLKAQSFEFRALSLCTGAVC
jgi:hypothetical protein